MKLFLDTCVILAACRSRTGSSRAIFDLAEWNGWELLGTNYVCGEVEKHIVEFHEAAQEEWRQMRARLHIVRTAWVIDRIAVFPNPKDKPVLCSAIRWADALLTHDRSGFQELLGTQFFGLLITTPGKFIKDKRVSGILKVGP